MVSINHSRSWRSKAWKLQRYQTNFQVIDLLIRFEWRKYSNTVKKPLRPCSASTTAKANEKVLEATDANCGCRAIWTTFRDQRKILQIRKFVEITVHSKAIVAPVAIDFPRLFRYFRRELSSSSPFIVFVGDQLISSLIPTLSLFVCVKPYELSKQTESGRQGMKKDGRLLPLNEKRREGRDCWLTASEEGTKSRSLISVSTHVIYTNVCLTAVLDLRKTVLVLEIFIMTHSVEQRNFNDAKIA